MMTFSAVPYSGSRLDASLELGQKISDEWGLKSLMIQMARDITKEQRTRTRLDESRAIYSWVNRRVRYVPDPHGAEMMSDPLTTIKNGGDCDDMAILCAALLQAIGHDARVGAVTWEGRSDPSHAVAVDLTARCVVDPCGTEPESWPPVGFKVQAIKYRDKAGQLQTMNGLFSKLVKAIAKPIQKVFPAKTVLGKIVDPLGLTDPSRNLNLVGRVADVVGTAATIAAGGYAIGAATAGTGAGLWGTIGTGFSTVAGGIGSAASAIGGGLATAAKAVLPALLLSGRGGGGGGQAAMTPEQIAAWQGYAPTPGVYSPVDAGGGVSYSGGGGGAGGYAVAPDGSLVPVSAPSSFPVLPVAAGAVLLLLVLSSGRKRKGK